MAEPIYRSVRYEFTRNEILDLGRALARESQALRDMTDRKALAASEFASQIKLLQARVDELTIKINQGYETREVEVTVVMSTPRAGVKTYYRKDTGEVAGEEAMTEQDRQASFAFEEKQAKEKTQ